MSNKVEAAVLKHLKKNPKSDVLDISMGTDLEEAPIKQALNSLANSGQVLSQLNERGVPLWFIAGASPSSSSPTAASKSSNAKVQDFDFEPKPSSGGVGFGTVLIFAVLSVAIALAGAWYIGNSQSQALQKNLATQTQGLRDSLGYLRLEMNHRLDSVEQVLRTPPPLAEVAQPEAPVKATKSKARPGKKRR